MSNFLSEKEQRRERYERKKLSIIVKNNFNKQRESERKEVDTIGPGNSDGLSSSKVGQQVKNSDSFFWGFLGESIPVDLFYHGFWILILILFAALRLF